MSFPSLDKLPAGTWVLVTRLNLGHRLSSGGHPACGSTAEVSLSTVQQCRAWSVMPCPECWGGTRPW